MPLENSVSSISNPLKNAVDIRMLEPIIFYSGKSDELQIHLKEPVIGELIIKSLNTGMFEIKEVMMADTNEQLNWKQNKECLKITFNAEPKANKQSADRVIKVTF